MTPKTHVDALLMKGGGVKGLAIAGALLELERYFSFTTFVGTSAGAIGAILLAAGYSADDLHDELQALDFADFIDESLIQKLYNAATSRGWHSGNAIEEWIDQRLSARLPRVRGPVTMRGLPNPSVVYASKPGRGTITFDSRTVDQDAAASAIVRYSMSIPYYFTRKQYFETYVYDGGLTANYPDDTFLTDNPGASILGIFLAPASGRSKTVLADLLKTLIDKDELVRVGKHPERTVWIDPSPIGTAEFDLTQAEKNLLVLAGRVGALEFLQNRGITGDQERLTFQRDRLNALRTKVIRTRSRKRTKKRGIWASVLFIVVGGLIAFHRGWFPEVSLTRQEPVINTVAQVVGDPFHQELIRIIFPNDGKMSGQIGRGDAKRAFVAPALYFRGGLTVGDAALRTGNKYYPDRNAVILVCRPLHDNRALLPKLATWANLADDIVTDLPKIPQCSADGLDAKARLYCYAKAIQTSADSRDTWVPQVLAGMYEQVNKLLADEGAKTELTTLYGVLPSFSGLGFTVDGSGQDAQLSVRDVFSRLMLPEYLVINADLQDLDCKCVTITPYPEREKDILDLDWIWAKGSIACPTVPRGD